MSPSPLRPVASVATRHTCLAPPTPANRPLADPPADCLSHRERTVVVALCEGLDRTEIARRLRRSRSTCDKAISGIYRTTGFGAAHQVVAWAHRIGLFGPTAAAADERRR